MARALLVCVLYIVMTGVCSNRRTPSSTITPSDQNQPNFNASTKNTSGEMNEASSDKIQSAQNESRSIGRRFYYNQKPLESERRRLISKAQIRSRKSLRQQKRKIDISSFLALFKKKIAKVIHSIMITDSEYGNK
ncbi:hypothetical protein Bpfe_004119 [Biomphalaria pfeifferi]|uniref:Uncharacterized protein n=1 Tax=Biomphalaria pfeifferi TaxID=112525 RepID=A0AAD8C575_BIOPF|nr:hypothetical protein Bpfe_004119 [Biomphalaria pfeifferi]